MAINLFKVYPTAGFHFLVNIGLDPDPLDISFQEVSGIGTTLTYEPYVEGGENRFVHHLPRAVQYRPLVLKRGFFVGSALSLWCKLALEDFVFLPKDVTVSLLNEQHIPLAAWYFRNALPKEWSYSPFDAQKNAIVIETLTLQYQYYTSIKV